MYFKPLSEEDKRRIAINREDKVFKHFFVANFKVLQNYAMMFVKDKHMAEDIASEVMWKMWHLGQDLLHVSSIEFYLMRAVKNKCLNHLRVKQAVYMGHEELANYQLLSDLNPENILISAEQVKRIENAVDALPTKTRQAFKLIKDENHSYKEAAEIMDISIKTVDRHIQIALQKLWETLKKKNGN